MKQRQLNFIFVILSLIGLAAVSIFAQTPAPNPKTTPPKDDDEVIKVESRLVVVPVSVTDSNGQAVTGLKAQDFRLAEANQTQTIDQVTNAEKVPLEIALLFDISASTDAMFQFEQETAAQFLKEVMRPIDRATIFTVGERPLMIQARESAEKSSMAIRNIRPTKEYTAFYDTVSAAADYLLKNSPVGSRKVVIVISDGEDTNSVGVMKAAAQPFASSVITSKMIEDRRMEIRDSEQAKVLRNLQNADTVFYAINPGGNSYQLNKMSLVGQSNLQKFSDETGGTAFLPKFLPVTLPNSVQNSTNMKKNQEILSKIFSQLANELQAQYLIQYYSEGDFANGQYVKLNVSLANPNSASLRARQGYFVKK